MIGCRPEPTQRPLRLLHQTASFPCRRCIVFEHCGGHELPLLQEFSCIQNWGAQHACDPDDMNPVHEERFWELWNDVNGLLDFRINALNGISSDLLPDYIPVIQHEGSRSRPPEVDVVAIPLFELLRMRQDGTYGPRFRTAEELRFRFKLRSSTKIILVGVDEDRMLERFWQEHRANDVGLQMAGLGLTGITAPNFSFFTDAPRFQVLRNRKRILLACESLSNAGIQVAPHLNALTPTDWLFWRRFLAEHAEISVICKEFQTGLKEVEKGRTAYYEIVKLQEAAGRPLHPILVAGGRYYRDAQKDFAHFTVIDSGPFMAALARQVQSDTPDGLQWRKRPTAPGQPIDDLFDQNVRSHRLKLASASADTSRPIADVEGQLLMYPVISNAHLRSQPAA